VKECPGTRQATQWFSAISTVKFFAVGMMRNGVPAGIEYDFQYVDIK
jgi:hypothetical protein